MNILFLKFQYVCIHVHRDIEDLQRQNQRLIAVIRELSEKKEEEEKLATESK